MVTAILVIVAVLLVLELLSILGLMNAVTRRKAASNIAADLLKNGLAEQIARKLTDRLR